MTTSSEWVAGPQKTSFYTKLFLPESPSPPTAVVLFLHGFIEHVERYNQVFPLWSSRGIAVVAFDQRGFGKTATDKEHNKGEWGVYGKTSTEFQKEDVESMIGWTKKRFGEGVKVFLMGHSMGGAIALTFGCTRSPKQIAGVIATSPLIQQTAPAPGWKRAVGGLISKFSPWSGVPAPVNPADLSHDPAVGEVYMKDPLVIHHGTLRGVSTMLSTGDDLLASQWKRWPKDLPLLLVHGSADKVTSHDASSKFVKSLDAKDKTFTTYDGGYHELHNEPDGVREKLVEECSSWVQKRAVEDGAQQSKL